MAFWKLARWKPCDGGCCVRSPRFPRPADLGTVLGRHPNYMADCIYHLNLAGGTNPDGSEWRGGCAIYQEILAIIAARNASTNMTRIRLQDLNTTKLQEIRAATEPPQGAWDYAKFPTRSLQWFADCCWRWPVATTIIGGFHDRLKALGMLIAGLETDKGMNYTTVYTDAQRQQLRQEWHVTNEQVKAGTAIAEEPACCHYWQMVDAAGNPV